MWSGCAPPNEGAQGRHPGVTRLLNAASGHVALLSLQPTPFQGRLAWEGCGSPEADSAQAPGSATIGWVTE